MDGYVTIGTELDTKGFDKEIAILEDKLNDIKATLQMADQDKTLFSTSEIKQMEAEAQKLGRKIDSLKEKQKKLDTAGFAGMQNSVENVGKSVQKVTKKIAKMALAVFGIRSAFMFVRNAINTISSDDAQLKADIDYMKNALAYTLEPLVRAIVNLAKQLMFYVGYIIKAWTGKNIFENANKSLKKANGEAKKLSKTLAGFDEMNILSDVSSESGGATTPSFDLTAPEDIDAPAWLKWIANNKDIVLTTLAGITAGLIAIKFGLVGIQALGIGLLLAGIVYSIQALINYINSPSWKNFGKIITGIGVALLGLSAIFGSVPLAVAGAITLILGIMAQFWDKIENFLNNLKEKIFNAGDNIMNWLRKNFGLLGDIVNVAVGTIIGVITSAIDIVTNIFGGLFRFIRSILDSIILVFKGDFKGALETILKGIGNLFIDVINVVISALNLITSPIRGLIVAIGKIMGKGWTMENIRIPKIPRLAKGGIINQPSRGVPVGNAIAGEKGQEGVIPLTDSQQMALLGEAIGKYININATIPVYVGNRQIARELRKIDAEDNFAYNR